MKAKKRFNQYLIFYVIMAAGLLMAWGQVGQKYKQDKVQTSSFFKTHFLWPEEDCNLNQQVCAAYRKDFAVVVGVSKASDEYIAVKLKMVGQDKEGVAGVKARAKLISQNYSDTFQEFYVSGMEDWKTEVEVGAISEPMRLEIRFNKEDDLYVTEFPFHPGELQLAQYQ